MYEFLNKPRPTWAHLLVAVVLFILGRASKR